MRAYWSTVAHPIPDLFIETARHELKWLGDFGLVESRYNADNNGALLVYEGPEISLWLALEQTEGYLSCRVSCKEPSTLPGGPVVLDGSPITNVYLSEILRATGLSDQADRIDPINADDAQDVVSAVRAFSEIAKVTLAPVLSGDWLPFQSAAKARKPRLPPGSR